MKYKVKNALLFTLQRGKLNFEKKQKGVCENERSISYYIRRFRWSLPKRRISQWFPSMYLLKRENIKKKW